MKSVGAYSPTIARWSAGPSPTSVPPVDPELHLSDDAAPVLPPFVILLDLNLPRMDGIEFLRNIRDDAALQDSVVFVLTTSNSDRDRVAAVSQRVAGYLLKSETDEEFSQLVRELRPVLRYSEN